MSEKVNKEDVATSPERKIAVANKTSKIISLANVGQRSAEEMVAAGFKRYGLEKGMLIFRMDGAVNGTEHLYFDHWGWREGKYIKTEADVGTYKEKTNTVQFLDGERRYEFNPETGEAYFFESQQVQKSADKYGTKNMVLVGDEMLKKMGGVQNGTQSIKGVMCQTWDITRYNTILQMWKGITMAERSHPGNIPVARTCILIDTTSIVPIGKIILPKNAKEVRK